MDETYREQLMDRLAGRLQRKAIRYELPVEEVVYDTDDAGKIEWIHIVYKGGHMKHVVVTGMAAQEVYDLFWEKMQKRV